MDGHSWWPLFENIPTEYLESYYPLRIDGYTTVTDSGGAGFHRGGNGVEKRYVYLEPGEVSIHDDRWLTQPWGVLGGKPGERSDEAPAARGRHARRCCPRSATRSQVEPGRHARLPDRGRRRLEGPRSSGRSSGRGDVAYGLVSREKARARLRGRASATPGGRPRPDGSALASAPSAATSSTFDFGPPLDEAIARCKAETGLDPPRPARPLRWSPLESGEDALARVREGDGIPAP